MSVFVPDIVLIPNPVVDFPVAEELENFPTGDTVGYTDFDGQGFSSSDSTISIIRSDFPIYSYRVNRTLQDVIHDSQALMIIQRFSGMTVSNADINRMPGLTSKERRIVMDYLARVRYPS